MICTSPNGDILELYEPLPLKNPFKIILFLVVVINDPVLSAKDLLKILLIGRFIDAVSTPEGLDMRREPVKIPFL